MSDVELPGQGTNRVYGRTAARQREENVDLRSRASIQSGRPATADLKSDGRIEIELLRVVALVLVLDDSRHVAGEVFELRVDE
jgi:hypothetical protein